LNKNPFGWAAKELHSTRINAGKRDYFFDLKMNSTSEKGEPSNSLIIKISEKNKENSKKSSVLFGLSDIYEAIQSLKKAFDSESVAKMPEPYAILTSKLFEHKDFQFSSRENNFGRYITIKESYSQGVRMDTNVQVFINEETMPRVIHELEKHLDFATNKSEP
jgi:hypothetical protein